MRIFLIGFMGSGKSYVGRRLAALLSMPFLDLDEEVERGAEARVRDIFEQKGEAWFRQRERQALHQMLSYPSAVIACGGGTPCFFDNLEWMKANGLTAYLKVPAGILADRLQHQQAQRPLLKGMDASALFAFIEKKLAERGPFYDRASIVYHQQSADEQVPERLLGQINEYLAQ